jgi:hypothetical protein
MFTGSSGHQSDTDGRIIRERMAPVFQDMGIDLVLQGHDHVYEVIGVLHVEKTEHGITYTHLPDAVSGQTTVDPTLADGSILSESVTGKEGGIYNVANGTVYFLNNSAGKKKYYPCSAEQMENAFPQHGVPHYFEQFNKFGQTGKPTFSLVKVSTDNIQIDTYTVYDDGATEVFDSFRIVK